MSSEENPADRSGDVDREPLKEELREISGGRTCPGCGEHVDIEEDEIIHFSYNLDGEHNSQVVHKKCFFEDTKQEVEEE